MRTVSRRGASVKYVCETITARVFERFINLSSKLYHIWGVAEPFCTAFAQVYTVPSTHTVEQV